MSGGHFDYQQYKIDQIADQVEQLILDNDNALTDEYDDRIGRGYSDETMAELKKGLLLLRQAAVYTRRIDWLVSGDDGEESFHRRLQADLREVGSSNNSDAES
jgi:hypothetical protein